MYHPFCHYFAVLLLVVLLLGCGEVRGEIKFVPSLSSSSASLRSPRAINLGRDLILGNVNGLEDAPSWEGKVDRGEEPLAMESSSSFAKTFLLNLGDEKPSMNARPVIQFHESNVVRVPQPQPQPQPQGQGQAQGQGVKKKGVGPAPIDPMDMDSMTSSEEEDSEEAATPPSTEAPPEVTTTRHRRRLMLLQSPAGNKVAVPDGKRRDFSNTTPGGEDGRTRADNTNDNTETTLRPPKEFIIYSLPEQSFWDGRQEMVAPPTPIHFEEDLNKPSASAPRQGNGNDTLALPLTSDPLKSNTNTTTQKPDPSPEERLRMTLAEKKFHLGQCMRYCMDAIL